MPRGCQEPTLRICPSHDRSLGEAAIRIADSYGMPPHRWQRDILMDWLALDDDGSLKNSLCVLTVPRQNGKTGVSDPRESLGLITRGEWILHTAQESQTARKAFDRLRAKFGECRNDPHAKHPELNAMVDRYTTSMNQMILDLKNGGHIEFRTRGTSGDVGRGGTFDLVVVDEAQSYTDEQDAALSPLNSAAPHGSPQTIFMGTVPDPTKPYKGKKFRELRDGLIASPDDHSCYHEWGAPEIGDVLDRERWYRYNPSLGYQLLLKGLTKDVRSMTPETFAREHLGWWPEYAGKAEPALNVQAWRALATDSPSQSPERTAYGVRFSVDGQQVALSVAEQTGGVTHIELLELRPMTDGLTWLVEWLTARADVGSSVGVDGKSGVQALLERMSGAPRGYVLPLAAAQAGMPASMLADAIADGSLTWYAPQSQVLESVETSTRRPIGRDGAWGFAGGSAVVLESLAIALWALRTTARDPSVRGRVYF